MPSLDSDLRPFRHLGYGYVLRDTTSSEEVAMAFGMKTIHFVRGMSGACFPFKVVVDFTSKWRHAENLLSLYHGQPVQILSPAGHVLSDGHVLVSVKNYETCEFLVLINPTGLNNFRFIV